MKKWIAIILGALLLPGIILLVVNLVEDFNLNKKVSTATEFIEALDDGVVSIELKADLDFDGIEWKPRKLDAHIIGNDHKIANVNISVNSGDNVGMFTTATNREISDLKLTNITIDYYGSGKNIGGLIGYAEDVDIKNVEIDGEIYASAGNNVGGLVGYMFDDNNQYNDKLSNLTNRAYVNGGCNVGGIFGYVSGEYNPCCNNLHNYGEIRAVKGFGGGVIGYFAVKKNAGGRYSTGALTNCSNVGKISGETTCGGIVGAVRYVKVESCKNSGEVTVSGDDDLICNAGGIVGVGYYSNIFACTNEGNILAEFNYVGGIAGRVESTDNPYSDDIRGCNYSNNKNTGMVKGKNHIGGVFGVVYGRNIIVTSCENEGMVEGDYNAGGIVGILTESKDSEVVYCNNKGNVTAVKYAAGIIGRATAGNFEEMSSNQNSGKLSGEVCNDMYNYSED